MSYPIVDADFINNDLKVVIADAGSILGVQAARGFLKDRDRERTVSVSAMLETKDSPFARELEDLGAKIILYSHNDPNSIRAGLGRSGAPTLILIPPATHDLVIRINSFLTEAQHTIISVYFWSFIGTDDAMSLPPSLDTMDIPPSDRPTPNSLVLLKEAEELVIHALPETMDRVVLRSGFPLQTFFYLSNLIQNRATIPFTSDTAHVAPIDIKDMGRASARLFHFGHGGIPEDRRGSVITLTGVEAQSGPMIVSSANAGLSHPLAFGKVSMGDMRAFLSQTSISPFDLSLVLGWWQLFAGKRLEVVTTDLQDILGGPEQISSIPQFFSEHGDKFLPRLQHFPNDWELIPSLSHGALSIFDSVVASQTTFMTSIMHGKVTSPSLSPQFQELSHYVPVTHSLTRLYGHRNQQCFINDVNSSQTPTHDGLIASCISDAASEPPPVCRPRTGSEDEYQTIVRGCATFSIKDSNFNYKSLPFSEMIIADVRQTSLGTISNEPFPALYPGDINKSNCSTFDAHPFKSCSGKSRLDIGIQNTIHECAQGEVTDPEMPHGAVRTTLCELQQDLIGLHQNAVAFLDVCDQIIHVAVHKLEFNNNPNDIRKTEIQQGSGHELDVRGSPMVLLMANSRRFDKILGIAEHSLYTACSELKTLHSLLIDPNSVLALPETFLPHQSQFDSCIANLNGIQNPTASNLVNTHMPVNEFAQSMRFGMDGNTLDEPNGNLMYNPEKDRIGFTTSMKLPDASPSVNEKHGAGELSNSESIVGAMIKDVKTHSDSVPVSEASNSKECIVM